MASHFERSFRLTPSATAHPGGPRPGYLRFMRLYGWAALIVGPLGFVLSIPVALAFHEPKLVPGGIKSLVSGVLIWLVLFALADIVEGVQDIRDAVAPRGDEV